LVKKNKKIIKKKKIKKSKKSKSGIIALLIFSRNRGFTKDLGYFQGFYII